MKQLILALAILCSFTTCKKTDDLAFQSLDPLSPEFDNTNYGNYNGVFTTSNSKIRGIIDIIILENRASAQLKTDNGVIHNFIANNNHGLGENTQLYFIGTSGNFTFKVGATGSKIELNNIVLNNEPGHFLVKKNTAKAPSNPVTGTYNCTNCNTGQAADSHPFFTTNAVTQTFNFLFSGSTGSGSIATQIMYDGTEYSTGSGSEGSVNGNVSGSSVVLDNNTSDKIVSIGGTSSVIANVDWEGTHNFNSQLSTISGFWDFTSSGYTMEGTFQGTETDGSVVEDLEGEPTGYVSPTFTTSGVVFNLTGDFGITEFTDFSCGGTNSGLNRYIDTGYGDGPSSGVVGSITPTVPGVTFEVSTTIAQCVWTAEDDGNNNFDGTIRVTGTKVDDTSISEDFFIDTEIDDSIMSSYTFSSTIWRGITLKSLQFEIISPADVDYIAMDNIVFETITTP